ncbi:MAG: RidA family protein [Promethearchaeota archaeon]|jgi:2-iminobutanoate/2-iminopropanoate deaminase
MTEKEVIDIGAAKAGPYSLGLKVGNLIFVSGQVMEPGASGIKEQTITALEKIKKIIEAAGATVSDIVKITVYLKNMSDFKEMNNAYKGFFEKNRITEKYPTRSTIEAVSPLPNALVEIDAIAVI